MIEGRSIARGVIRILVFGLIFFLLYWLVGFLKLPAPFSTVALALLAIGAVVILINELMLLIGKGFIDW